MSATEALATAATLIAFVTFVLSVALACNVSDLAGAVEALKGDVRKLRKALEEKATLEGLADVDFRVDVAERAAREAVSEVNFYREIAGRLHARQGAMVDEFDGLSDWLAAAAERLKGYETEVTDAGV